MDDVLSSCRIQDVSLRFRSSGFRLQERFSPMPHNSACCAFLVSFRTTQRILVLLSWDLSHSKDFRREKGLTSQSTSVYTTTHKLHLHYSVCCEYSIEFMRVYAGCLGRGGISKRNWNGNVWAIPLPCESRSLSTPTCRPNGAPLVRRAGTTS